MEKHEKENVCIDCKHYEACGKPERFMRCLGYEKAANAKRQTSRGMRRAVKRSCTDESITLRGKSKNLYGYDSWLFS